MVPETYNEESSSNDYTGRPEGEMSLYTSSMNSSESNNYRLRMYVDEEYNPQGDGGGLVFTVQVNVYGKAGDKYVPLTTREILEDNELQEETTNMFNYASNGNYTNFDGDDLYDSNYITNGLYEAKDEDGVSYYFRGAVTNNNVQFGEYASDYYVYQGNYNSYYQSEVSCKEAGNSTCTPVLLASRGDKMYWKIVRVNGDGSLRLIYNGTSTNPNNNDLASSFAVGVTPYNLEFLDPKYTGYTYDNGTDSIAKKEVDSWYDNTLGKSSYDKMITNGRFCSDSSEYQYSGINDYDTVFAGAIRLSQAWNDFEEVNNAPSLICPVTSESYGGSYRLKAGLITADELVLAGESLTVVGNSYLNSEDSEMYYWSMTPAGSTSGCYDIFVYGEMLNVRQTVSRFAIRPVINVKADNGFTSGDGSTENPYAIE